MEISKSAETVLREGVELATQHGAPAEVVMNLLRAECDKLEQVLVAVRSEKDQLAGIVSRACGEVLAHHPAELVPKIEAMKSERAYFATLFQQIYDSHAFLPPDLIPEIERANSMLAKH